MNLSGKLDLADLFNRYGSDKDRNGYSHLYSVLFDNLKDKPLNVLEIGIGTMVLNAPSSMKGYMPDEYKPGASLRAWRDYFINSKIYGCDIQEDTQFEEERISTFICDSTKPDNVNAIFEDKLKDTRFDIIIDDGWHYDEAQISTLKNFFPYLKEGGFYIIEDIYPGSKLNSTTPKIIRDIIGDYEHFFVGLCNNQCVIRKKKIHARGNC